MISAGWYNTANKDARNVLAFGRMIKTLGGVSMSKTYQSNGGMTANEMDSVMAKHFAKIQTNTTNIDRKGFSQWVGRNGNKTIQDNNRVSRTGFKV